MSDTAVPVTILTGFLGSGKSTLLQSWLEELPRDDIAVIVNERGEVGVDGELLAAHVARLREITGSCVCCSGREELVMALHELSGAMPTPRRIFVETSGAATPAGAIRGITASRARERLELDGVFTVVDVTRVAPVLRFDVAVEQLSFADVVVLSHVDRAAGASEIEKAQMELARYAPAAVFANAEHGRVSHGFRELLSARSKALHVPREGTGHASIEAASFVVEGELDEERFGDWVEGELGGIEARILRVKGILAMRDVEARVIVQGVSEAVHVQLGAPWRAGETRTSKLVVLGLGLDAEALETGFRRCVASPSRRAT